jgi:hypothetical protein
MKTGIRETFQKWLPELYIQLQCEKLKTDYEILNQYATYTVGILDTETTQAIDILKIIHLIYRKGNLFERNAIENEFFLTMAQNEKSNSIKLHLGIIPEELKSIYLKTIIEN